MPGLQHTCFRGCYNLPYNIRRNEIYKKRTSLECVFFKKKMDFVPFFYPENKISIKKQKKICKIRK